MILYTILKKGVLRMMVSGMEYTKHRKFHNSSVSHTTAPSVFDLEHFEQASRMLGH